MKGEKYFEKVISICFNFSYVFNARSMQQYKWP